MTDSVIELILTCVAIFTIVYILLSYWKTSQHRKQALFVIDMRSIFRVVYFCCALMMVGVVIITLMIEDQFDFLGVLISIAAFLMFLLLPSIAAIIVERKGIYYGMKLTLTPWDRINKISESFGFVHIDTGRKIFPLKFFRLFWKFSPKDIKRLQALLAKQKTSSRKRRKTTKRNI